MQANYFTPRYGGVEITWRAHMEHFPRWHDIDQQIWRFIEAWSIHPPTKQPQQP